MSSENPLLPRVWELERSLASAVRVNEALRQQLDEVKIVSDHNLKVYQEAAESLRQKISSLEQVISDLHGAILCNEEPVAYMSVDAQGGALFFRNDVCHIATTPLYKSRKVK